MVTPNHLPFHLLSQQILFFLLYLFCERKRRRAREADPLLFCPCSSLCTSLDLSGSHRICGTHDDLTVCREKSTEKQRVEEQGIRIWGQRLWIYIFFLKIGFMKCSCDVEIFNPSQQNDFTLFGMRFKMKEKIIYYDFIKSPFTITYTKKKWNKCSFSSSSFSPFSSCVFLLTKESWWASSTIVGRLAKFAIGDLYSIIYSHLWSPLLLSLATADGWHGGAFINVDQSKKEEKHEQWRQEGKKHTNALWG